MIKDYSYRTYQDGDAKGINELYERITGNERTIEQFDWQWRMAPGGPAEIWLIEAVYEGGAKELIGHHGVMPIRFSCGTQDLLFGKTENTMVLPEFRRKILYPRFERRFLSRYRPRFDALFSTLGPPAAIRQRKALGYEYPSKFVRFKIPTDRTSGIAYFGSRIGRIVNGRNRKAGKLPYGFNFERWQVSGSPELSLRILDDTSATQDPFFETFWSSVRENFGLTPRRDIEDLRWRFWNNPYKKHVVFVSDSPGFDTGYVILSRSVTSPNSADLEDIVPCDSHPESFNYLLQSVLCWLRNSPIRWLSFRTTEESCQLGKIASGLVRKNMWLFDFENRTQRPPDRYMPRLFTRNQLKNQFADMDWYVTPVIFEGRVAN